MKEERIRNVEKVEVTGWEASLPSAAPSSLRAQLTSPLREGGSYLSQAGKMFPFSRTHETARRMRAALLEILTSSAVKSRKSATFN